MRNQEKQCSQEQEGKLMSCIEELKQELANRITEQQTQKDIHDKEMEDVKYTHKQAMECFDFHLKEARKSFHSLSHLIEQILSNEEPNIKAIIGTNETEVVDEKDVTTHCKMLKTNIKTLHMKIQDYYTQKYATFCAAQ